MNQLRKECSEGMFRKEVPSLEFLEFRKECSGKECAGKELASSVLQECAYYSLIYRMLIFRAGCQVVMAHINQQEVQEVEVLDDSDEDQVDQHEEDLVRNV